MEYVLNTIISKMPLPMPSRQTEKKALEMPNTEHDSEGYGEDDYGGESQGPAADSQRNLLEEQNPLLNQDLLNQAQDNSPKGFRKLFKSTTTNDNSKDYMKEVLGLVFELKNTVEDLQQDLNRVKNVDRISCTQSMIETPKFPLVSETDISSPAGCRLVEFHFKNLKFNGNSKDKEESSSINDFLRGAIRANAVAQLNEDDFLTILISKTSGNVRNIFENWKLTGYTVDEIFSSAYSTWNTEVTSTKASTLLTVYSIPKNFTFAEVLTDINHLCMIASLSGIDKASRFNMHENYYLNALLTRLPKEVKKIVEMQYIKLNQLNRTIPSSKDLVLSLVPYHSRINEELNSCRDYAYAPRRGVFDICKEKRIDADTKNKPFKFRKGVKTLSINAVSSSFENKNSKPCAAVNDKEQSTDTSLISEMHPKLNQAHIYALSNSMRSNTKNQTGKGKKYCTFCSGTNHSSSEGCYSVMNDSLRHVYATPSMRECAFCLEKVGKKLHHSSKTCPIRPVMIQAYKKGLVKPLGIFKAYFEKTQNSSK